ncbi:MAG: penicillin acylase family protein [Theionarchaea archaeon]|nr:penicillin acylase family protein [Theionarchaea archaeon]
MKHKLYLGALIALTLVLSYAVSPFMPYLNPSSGLWKYSQSVEHPATKEITGLNLNDDVRIERDTNGVPHIYAKNDLDLFFALGYVHAQDRLFQIDLQRRLPSGRLSEIVGEDAYESDTFYRTLGMHRAAEETYSQMSQWSRDIADAYCAGVNQYITNANPYPIEYTLLQCNPEEYTPIDAITFGKMMGWELSGSFYDLEVQKMEEALGAEIVQELFPSQRPVNMPIIPGLSEACKQILLWSNQAIRIPLEVGSNNWAVSPQKSQSGRPMLCNDPHLSTTLPSLWYQVHMVSPSYNVAGVTLPGTPCVLIGRNQRIAWGLTNTGADVIDFYVETLSEDGTTYFHQGTWHDVTQVQEVINIKGSSPRTLTVSVTGHGPILERDGKQFAVCWTGLQPTFEFEALLLINKASNYQQYEEGLTLFSVAAQNFVYADIYGNIAIRSTGRIPIRKKGTGRAPVDGASGDYDWTGYIPFEELPHAFNPDQGYLASANQIPVSLGYPYYLGFIWADRYRAERINTLLREKELLTMEDMIRIQSDIYDIPASIITPMIVEVITPQNDAEEEALHYLKTWDYNDERTQVAPLIYHTFLDNFMENIFHDEYEEAGIPDAPYPTTETLENMLKACGRTNFFDDVSTSEVETAQDIIQKSFQETIEQLVDQFTEDVTTWSYGQKHIFSLEHLIGSVVTALNYPQFPYDGSSNTVDVAWGWTSKGGPSWREIIDFDHDLCMYPGGQSGNPFSRHYTDFVELWKESQYLPWELEGYTTESVLILRRG